MYNMARSLVCLFFAASVIIFVIYYNADTSKRFVRLAFRSLSDDNSTIDFRDFRLTTTPEDTVILAWSKFFGFKYDEFEKLFDECPPELKCVATKNRNRLDGSAAVLFHVRNSRWDDRPLDRRPDQYYVFALWESPSYREWDQFDYYSHRDFFNLTMTYRRDSDIVWPYGDFQEIPSSDRSKFQEFKDADLIAKTGKKTKLIAWFVSNCKSKSGRERFVEKLSKYIPVDIYGRCGNLICSWEQKFSETPDRYHETLCHRMLTKDYKFYLSLENSICLDYVTEKFYLTMLYSLVVPIVLNRKILLDTVRDVRVMEALNRSFIAVDDFSTVVELAVYLKYLDQNTTAYVEYFHWRNNFRIVLEKYQYHPGCELCKIVKEKKEKKVNDVFKWWIDDANCQSYN